MAAPTFFGISAIAASTGADISITLPLNTLANDVGLCFFWVRDVDDTINSVQGAGGVNPYTQVTTWDRGTSTRWWIYWRRLTGDEGATAIVVDKSTATGDTYGCIVIYRGCITTGNPWDVLGVAQSGTNANPTLTGITTLTAESLIAVMLGQEDNNNTAFTLTGTDPVDYTEHYVESVVGADGTLCPSEAPRTGIGATGDIAVAGMATPIGWGARVLALIPPAPAPYTPSHRVSKQAGESQFRHPAYGPMRFHAKWSRRAKSGLWTPEPVFERAA